MITCPNCESDMDVVTEKEITGDNVRLAERTFYVCTNDKCGYGEER